MGKKKTHVEYVDELAKVNPDIEVVGIYIGNKVKIPHRCKIDGNVWDLSPDNALQGRGCPICGRAKTANKKRMSHEEYIERISKLHPNIEVIEEYRGRKEKIKHRCIVHDYDWDVMPDSLLEQKYGCPLCASEASIVKQTKTHEEYVYELAIKNPTVEVIGEYINAKTKILHHCIIHNVYWNIDPSGALQGHGCYECVKDRISASKYKSHEEYVEELKQKNPTIEVIDKYIDCHTPIKHKCLVDNYEWDIAPSNALSGKGCPKCAIKRITELHTKTHAQYVEELLNTKPHIEVVEEYVNSRTKIEHHCLIHDIFYYSTPSNALHASGCPECISNVHHNINRKTHEEYVAELEIVNPQIEVIDKYININTPIMHRCIIHDFKWETTPASTLQGCGCPMCRSEKIQSTQTKTHEEYIEDVKKINPNIKVLGKYVNAKTPLLHKCLIDDFEWSPVPSSILNGYGCPVCGRKRLKESLTKTHEEYVEQLKIINPNIIAIEKYSKTNTPILHRCLIDNFEWMARPTNVLNGCGCPKCNRSKGELKISMWLDKNNIFYEPQMRFDDCCDIKTLPFDFYIPSLKIAIEYDGKQHFEPIEYFGGEESFEILQKHDAIKNEYCKNNGISLLRIPYYKYNNIEEELNNFLFI